MYGPGEVCLLHLLVGTVKHKCVRHFPLHRTMEQNPPRSGRKKASGTKKSARKSRAAGEKLRGGRQPKRNSRRNQRVAAKNRKKAVNDRIASVFSELQAKPRPKGARRLISSSELLAACQKKYPSTKFPTDRTLRNMMADEPKIKRLRPKRSWRIDMATGEAVGQREYVMRRSQEARDEFNRSQIETVASMHNSRIWSFLWFSVSIGLRVD